MYGKKLSPILTEIELTILKFKGESPHYDDNAMIAASQIFVDVIMDKMFNLQVKENMDLETRCAMANKCGADIRQLIKTYTDLDSHDFYKI